MIHAIYFRKKNYTLNFIKLLILFKINYYYYFYLNC